MRFYTLAQGFQQIWGKWGAWSDCSTTCGGGSQTRSRKCVRPPIFADDCVGPELERKNCGSMPCDASKNKRSINIELLSIILSINRDSNTNEMYYQKQIYGQYTDRRNIVQDTI